jgi:hypothetical protein
VSIKVYISQSASTKRIPLELSDADYALLPRRVGVRAEVTDLLTGTKHTLRRTSCGLPHCMCDLALVEGKPKLDYGQ